MVDAWPKHGLAKPLLRPGWCQVFKFCTVIELDNGQQGLGDGNGLPAVPSMRQWGPCGAWD